MIFYSYYYYYCHKYHYQYHLLLLVMGRYSRLNCRGYWAITDRGGILRPRVEGFYILSLATRCYFER
jgi:hypothetical protein